MAAYRASRRETMRLYAQTATFAQSSEGIDYRAHYECAPDYDL